MSVDMLAASVIAFMILQSVFNLASSALDKIHAAKFRALQDRIEKLEANR